MCQAPGWSLSLTFLTATPQGRAFCCHPCFRDEENESLIHRHKHGSKRQNQDLKLGGRTPSPHSEHPHPAPTIRSQHAPHLWKSSPPALHAQSQTLHAPGPHLSQSALGPVVVCYKKETFISGVCRSAAAWLHLLDAFCVPGTLLSQTLRIQPARRGHSQDGNCDGKCRHCDRSCPTCLRTQRD